MMVILMGMAETNWVQDGLALINPSLQPRRGPVVPDVPLRVEVNVRGRREEKDAAFTHRKEAFRRMTRHALWPRFLRARTRSDREKDMYISSQ